MRLFIAAPVTPEIRDALVAVLNPLRAALGDAPVKWVEPKNLHLTLRFFGETPAKSVDEIVARARAACATCAPMNLEVAGLGCFPDFARPKVLWVGLEAGPQLAALHEAIGKATAEFGAEKSGGGTAGSALHRPHLTIGRVRDVSNEEPQRLGKKLEKHPLGEIGVWRLDRVALIRSDPSPAGPSYTELVSIPLAAV